MEVESVRSAAGPVAFQRVKLWGSVALAVLTVLMVGLWPYTDAHRSVASFVVTLLWTLAALTLSLLVLAGPRKDPDDEPAPEGSS